MAGALRVLILDDEPADAELVARELRRQGYAIEWRRADTRESLIRELDWSPDVILCDYYMPQLDAPSVLGLLQEKGHEIPFIVISGSVGDDLAASIIKEGAEDYLLKDRLARLGASIEHALREKRLRDEKSRVESELRQSEARFRSAFENAPVGMLLAGPDGRFLKANRSISAILGYSQQEFLGLDIRSITHPDDMPASQAAIERVLSGEDEFLSLEKRYLHKSGKVLWGHVTAFLQPETDLAPASFIAHIIDITERKASEEKIEKLTRMYAALSQVNEAIVRASDRHKLYETVCRIIVEQGRLRMAWIGFVDPETKLVKPAAWHGYEEGYLDGLVISSLDVPEGRGPTGTAVREDKHVINEDTTTDGRMAAWKDRCLARGYLSSAAFPLRLGGRPAGALTVYAPVPRFFDDDILHLLDELAGDLSYALDAMMRQEALQKSERRYRHLFERNQAAVARMSAEGRILDCNPAFLRMMGLTSIQEASQCNIQDFYAHPQEREWLLVHLRREGFVNNEEVEIIRRDGRFLTVLISVTLMRDDATGEMTVEGTAVDITEIRQGERERKLLSTALEQAHEAVMVTDTAGRILYVNPAFEGLSGYPRAELLHKNPRILKSDAHDQAFYADLWATLLKGRVWSGHIVNKRKDGSLYTVHSIISPIRDEKGALRTFVAAQRDVSEEQRMQESLERAKKLETIGMITGGVAHEVRNPLFAISTVAAALNRKLGGLEEYKEYMDHINEQVRRLSILMNNLLVLGRPLEPAEFTPCIVQDILRAAVAHAETVEGSGKPRFVLEIPDEPFAVMGIADKLEQVFVNVLQNASHFSERGEQVTVRLWRSDRSVHVEVLDRGPGIPEDFLPKIFEPFSSRRKGGTGLGLAIVRQIVSAHGGSVSAENNSPGPGTTFSILLPSARGS